MTTQEAIALAKKKLGKDITEQEAQDYCSGKVAMPDELLDIVSGGRERSINEEGPIRCPRCGSGDVAILKEFERYVVCRCNACSNAWQRAKFNQALSI